VIIVAIGLQKPYANQNQAQILYDLYWLTRWLLFTGSKYMEHTPSIRMMHNDIINQQQSIQAIGQLYMKRNRMNANAECKYTVRGL
jgi:hypothetical protein